MPTAKETYRGSYTKALTNTRESQADMVIHVTGLDGGRDSLETAVNLASAQYPVHPDDLTLPLRYATAKWFRGNDNLGNAEAFVYLSFDKRSQSVNNFNVVAEVDVRYITLKWWGETLAVPASAGSPEPAVLEPDPHSNNPDQPRPKYTMIEVPVWDILIPVVLTSSPVNQVDQVAGKINASSLTLSDKTFPQYTLRFNGLRQRVTGYTQGGTSYYTFDVQYSFSFREDGWYESLLAPIPTADLSEFGADKQLMYEAANWPTFPN